MTLEAFHESSGPVDARIGAALAKLALVGRRALDRSAATRSLSAVQALILECLARRGPQQVGALASLLAVTAPTVSDAIAALERKGLVRRGPVCRDARGVEVRLTPKGRKAAGRQAGWSDVFRQAVHTIAPEEKAVLLRLLLGIIAELVARGVVRDARMCVTCEYFRPYAHSDGPRPHHCALVDLPLSDDHLRVDCPDHAAVAPEVLGPRLRVLHGGAR